MKQKISEIKKFELTEDLLIGHKQIDGEHYALIKIFNELIEAYRGGNTELCEQKLHQFRTKLDEHFEAEDAIMAELGYSEPNHEEFHAKVQSELDAICGDFVNLAEWRQCILALLDNFIAVILKHDFKFAAYLKSINYKD